MDAPRQRIWPPGHGGWFYSGIAEFEAGVASFLAEGVQRHERAIFVAEELGPRRWPPHLVDEGVLVLASLDDVYEPLRTGDVAAQRDVLAAAVADALRDGFTGVRVAADNTAMVVEDLERWCAWEPEAEAFIGANPVTGLCGFDRARLSPGHARAMARLHGRLVESV